LSPVGTVIGFSQAKAADDLAGCKFGQKFAALRFGPVGIDRIHHQRRLHRHRRSVAGIHTLQFARDQTIGNITKSRTAILFRNGRTEQAKLAHLRQQVWIIFFVAECFDDTRHQIALRKATGAVAHHTLLFGQLAFQIERIFPNECRVLEHCGYPAALLRSLRHEASSKFFGYIIDRHGGA